MFDVLLSAADAPAGEIIWSAPAAGVRVCDFAWTPPACGTPAPTVPHCETLYCMTGTAQLCFADGRQLFVREGEILLLSAAAVLHEVRFSAGRFGGVLVTWQAGAARDSLRTLGTLLGGLPLDAAQAFALLDEHGGCAVVRGTVWGSAVFSALGGMERPARGQYATLKAVELLYLLHRRSPLTAPDTAAYVDPYLTDTVRELHDYMLDHLGDRLTIGVLAARFQISPTSLKTCFRRLYGQPLHQYLQQQRLRRAAELLADSPLPVNAVAERVGYGSASQFGVAFRRMYQLSPSHYRRAHLTGRAGARRM